MSIAEIGHNQGPSIDARHTALLETGKRWFNEYPAITDDKVEAACADYINQVRAWHKESEASRKAEKAPIIEAGKRVDERYKTLQQPLDKIVTTLKGRLGAYLQQKEAARLEAERIAREMAEQAAREAEEAERKAIQNHDFDAMQEAERQAEIAEQAEKKANEIAQQKSKAKGNIAPRAMSLRTTYSAKITNHSKALQAYTDHPRVKEAVQQAANEDARRLKDTLNIPGVELVKTQTAV